MTKNLLAWEIALQKLDNLVSEGVLTKSDVTESNVKFFDCKLRQIALETPRGTRNIKGAKFWFSFKPNISTRFKLEEKAKGVGRNNKLEINGSKMGKEFNAWTMLVGDDSKDKEEQITTIISSIAEHKNQIIDSLGLNINSDSTSINLLKKIELQRDMESALNDVKDRVHGEDVDAIVKRRVGQSLFRDLLVSQHGSSCHISQMNNRRLLIASHIVPWSKSTGDEKTDPDNGLLLAANWDAVFDKGLITFDDEGNTIFSNTLDEGTRTKLGIDGNLRLKDGVLNKNRLAYLERHRNEFIKREMPV